MMLRPRQGLILDIMSVMLLFLRSGRAFRSPTPVLPWRSNQLQQWKRSVTLPLQRVAQGQAQPFALTINANPTRTFRTLTTANSNDDDGNNSKRTPSNNSSSRTGGGRGGGQRRNNNRRRNNRPPPPPLPTTPGSPGRGCFRELITPGLDVWVIQKEHQRSGQETRGEVQRLLTKSPYHPRGIKVMLQSGQVGRVTRIASE